MEVRADKLDQLLLRKQYMADPYVVPTVLEVAYHRNGISGQPFYVALVQERFEEDPEDIRRKVIVMMDSGDDCTAWISNFAIAVLDVDMTWNNTVTFGENSWRGDRYRNFMLECIRQYDQAVRDWSVPDAFDGGKD